MNKGTVLLFLLSLYSYLLTAQEMGEIKDGRDGEVYKTVKIGNQVWMAENLRYKAEGSLLNPDNPSVEYGRLYAWNGVMGGSKSSANVPSGVQGICPEGWHVPSDKEWKILEQALGMSQKDADISLWRGTDQGAQMKSLSAWNKNFNGQTGNGSNSSGFNAFPAGGYLTGGFNGLGFFAYYWSSTEDAHHTGWGRTLSVEFSKVFRYDSHKSNFSSCRCVKN